MKPIGIWLVQGYMFTKEQIEEINSSLKDSWNQGIFIEPNWIPSDIKEPVVYMRWIIDGYSGGNCWGDKSSYFQGDGEPKFEALDATLRVLCPDLSYLKYREVEAAIRSNTHEEYAYYGNSDNYGVKFIPISVILEIVGL